jgi:putative inorganic carbon (HCO3(-)) transporter
LSWLFGLVLGITYAATGTGGAVDWLPPGALLAVMLLLIGADNVKFWIVLYPLIFVAPRLQLGGWSEGSEQLFGLQLYEPWMLLLLAAGVPRLLATKPLALPGLLKLILGLLFCLGLFAIGIAPDRLSALKSGSRTFFEPLFLFVLITSLSWRRSEVRWVTFVLVGVGALVTAISIVEYGTRVARPLGLNRLDASWEGSNVEAAFLGAVIPIALRLLLSARSPMAVGGWLVALIVSGTGLVLTYTRGAWIAVTVAVMLQIAWMRAWVSATLVCLVLFLGLLVAPPEILERLRSIATFTHDPSASNRLTLWPQVVGLIANQPLTGYGFNNRTVELATGSYHAHNIFLDFAVTLGVPALVMFLAMVAYVLGWAFTTLRRSGHSEDGDLLSGLWAGTFSILLAGIFDGSILIWAVLAHTFWLMLALTFSFAVSIEREPAWPARAYANSPRTSP